jgi:hypothetical protein
LLDQPPVQVGLGEKHFGVSSIFGALNGPSPMLLGALIELTPIFLQGNPNGIQRLHRFTSPSGRTTIVST